MHSQNEKEVSVELTRRRRSSEAFDGRSFCRYVALFTVTSNVHMFTFVCIHSLIHQVEVIGGDAQRHLKIKGQ